MRGIDMLAMLATAALVPVAPVSAAMAEGGAVVSAKDKMICKRTQRTGTRFFTKICKTSAQWDAISEQHKRDAREMVDRPQVEIRRD